MHRHCLATMKKRQRTKRTLLFIACINGDENFDAGLTYAADLAALMKKDMSMLIIDCFQKIMMSVTYAEADEDGKALGTLNGENGNIVDQSVNQFMERCSELGINLTIHYSRLNVRDAVAGFMNKDAGVDMVLLGPSVIDNGNISSSELNKLVRTASRPIVTISRQESNV